MENDLYSAYKDMNIEERNNFLKFLLFDLLDGIRERDLTGQGHPRDFAKKVLSFYSKLYEKEPPALGIDIYEKG
jgi:hypothetical protein